MMGSDNHISVKLSFNHYGEGQPLVILHGLFGSGSNWHTLSRTVFGDRFSVYAVDLRNHGQSPHTSEMDYVSMADDVRAFIEDRRIAKAHVLGHSMGGKVAMQLALTWPDLVDRLIIVDVAPRVYRLRHEQIIAALKSIAPENYSSRADIDEALSHTIESAAERQLLLKNLRYDRGAYRWIINLSAMDRFHDRVADSIMADGIFDGPVIVIRGALSDYVGEDDVTAIEWLFPNAQIETIEHAGHWVHADRPEEFAKVVMSFLDETTESVTSA